MTRRRARGRTRSHRWLSVSRIARDRHSLTAFDCVIGIMLLLLGAVTLVFCLRAGDQSQSFTTVGPGGDVRVAMADVVTGKATFIQYLTSSGNEVRFFVRKGADGVTRSAFDACVQCYRDGRGFRQAGSRLVCNSCRKSVDQVSVVKSKDDCHPVPLEQVIEGNTVILHASALERGAWLFK